MIRDSSGTVWRVSGGIARAPRYHPETGWKQFRGIEPEPSFLFRTFEWLFS